MKKLMTMLAAAAMAFGLYAADDGFKSGTAFESNDGGNSYDAGFVAGYWEGTGVGTTTVQEVSHGITMEALRPDYFAGEADVHTLAIKTTLGNPVTHKVNTSGNGEPIADSGFYFDGLVNMTAFDEDPDLSLYDKDDGNPVKIAVYIQEATNNVGEVTGTNLVVVAKPTTAVPDGRFVCSKAKLPDDLSGWHRLTIKAINNITTTETPVKAGFVVFVDGVAMECAGAEIDPTGLTMAAADWNEKTQLFVSLAETDATVKSISFDGQGSVDELVFTETAPTFAQDLNIAKVAYNGDAAMNVQYSTNGTDWVDAVGNPFKVAALRGQELPASITVRWTGKGIYMDQPGFEVTLAKGKQATIGDSAYTTAAAAIIEGATTNKFTTLAGAAAVAAGKTIVLFNDVTEDVTFTVTGATLDLNGQTLTAVDFGDEEKELPAITMANGASLMIADNADTKGTINGSLAFADEAEATVSITAAATFNGDFQLAASISAGSFSHDANLNIDGECGLTTEGHGGYKWEAKNNYWVLAALAKVAFSVQPATNTKATSIKIAGADASAATEITEGQSYEVIFTADDGYEFEGGDATETVTGTAETTAVTVAPTKNVVAKKIAVTGVTLDQDTLTLKVGDDVTLVATVAPDNATDKSVSWTSDTLAVATVENGTVHAVAAGKAIITVTTTDGGKMAICTVTVSAAVQPVVPGEPVNLSPEEAEAQKATLLKAPNLELVGAELTAYQNFFKAVVNPKGDGSVFVFNPEAKNEAGKTLAEQATADAAQALTGNSITVTAVKGLYYGLSQAGALDEMAVTDAQQATGKEITFTPNKEGPAGFWTIIVSDVAIDVPDPE